MTATLQTLRRPSTSARDSIDQYLDEISAYALLSETGERALAVRARNGDAAALDELVAANLRFVVSIAKRFQHRGVSLSDLIGEGNVGLIAAAERFDPERGVRFITYAVWWIRQAMLGALSRQSNQVRVPANSLMTARKIHRLTNALRHELGREPSRAELMSRTGMTAEALDALQDLRIAEISLDGPVSGNSPRLAAEELAGTESDESTTDSGAALDDALSRALDSLRPREASILKCYFGIGGESPRTLDQIAAELRVTRERVRQLRDRALGKLRHGSSADVLASFARAG